MIRRFAIAVLFIATVLALMPAVTNTATFDPVGVEIAVDDAPDLMTADDADHREPVFSMPAKPLPFEPHPDYAAWRGLSGHPLWRPPCLV